MFKFFNFLILVLILAIPGFALADLQQWLHEPGSTQAPQVNHDPTVTTVRGHLLAKVIYSNFVTLRPGSVYDMRYLFEQNLGPTRPTFNYTFSDLGLGTAEPLYAIYESGYQGNYKQLIESSSEPKRHLDHFSDMVTPDGCRVQSVYIVRSTAQYPELYKEERRLGYTIVDASWDYTTRLFPGAQCGHHRANDPDPHFDPIKAIKPYLKHFKTMEQIPAKLLAKYEAKVNLELELSEKLYSPLQKTGGKTYAQLYNFKDNSFWYYPDGHAENYGINTPRPQPGLSTLSKPQQFILPATNIMRESLALPLTMTPDDFGKYADFINGHPTSDFDPSTEPGNDAFSLSQITTKHFLTSGLEVVPITNPQAVQEMVLNPANYRLVAAVIRPNETELDPHLSSGQVSIPELRLVYQLEDPQTHKIYDQAFIHSVYDAVDRYADKTTRYQQGEEFFARLDALTALRMNQPELADAATIAFIQETISPRPLRTLAFSSALTGIWVFGNLSWDDSKNKLVANRQIRHGIDVGYYSTLYDALIFDDAAKKATGTRKAELDDVIQAVIPNSYRDPRRNDVSAITFNSVTCAMCHQMAARDGVHVKINDGLDRRMTSPITTTEYLYRVIDDQLKSRQSK